MVLESRSAATNTAVHRLADILMNHPALIARSARRMDTSHTTGRAACVAAALGVIWWAGTAEAQSPFLLTTPSYTQDFSALYDTANS
ncbi:MAG TPA: hypothetical protein VGP24_16020, partial [Glaciihabitans sp.]|nr:hypothetical protein [Glaciihabitans sp.]